MYFNFSFLPVIAVRYFAGLLMGPPGGSNLQNRWFAVGLLVEFNFWKVM
jgi:hypothetical protein